jgi:hypothetical protein
VKHPVNSPRTLSTFLRARIREEESAALEARRWFQSVAGTPQGEAVGRSRTQPTVESFAAFVLAHEPDRVLKECIAKRKIINMVTGPGWSGSTVERDALLRLLALPYTGHPDFRIDWRDS